MTYDPLGQLRCCVECGVYFSSSSNVYQQKCYVCLGDQAYNLSPTDLLKADKRYAELEDKVRILEEALEESEAELAYKEAQLNLALELAYKAHDLRVKLDSLQPYQDQPMLPFGDLPQ